MQLHISNRDGDKEGNLQSVALNYCIFPVVIHVFFLFGMTLSFCERFYNVSNIFSEGVLGSSAPGGHGY